ncbi:hypothetical protein T01_7325 [Trichinella spiralis]|uniref:Uncharacterized protein n=1 Tax=Trichinella spiralis TaxID=6334 RepID=A0A0V1BAE4_TRISP|nr:hypothetical protein T01_7325 [Trichinella spiralis]
MLQISTALKSEESKELHIKHTTFTWHCSTQTNMEINLFLKLALSVASVLLHLIQYLANEPKQLGTESKSCLEHFLMYFIAKIEKALSIA